MSDTIEPSARDFLMARVAAARSCAQAVINACDEIVDLCMDPDEDKKLRQRKELVDDALDLAGATARALEAADAALAEVDPLECEPWDEEGDEEESEIELPRATARKRGGS